MMLRPNRIIDSPLTLQGIFRKLAAEMDSGNWPTDVEGGVLLVRRSGTGELTRLDFGSPDIGRSILSQAIQEDIANYSRGGRKMDAEKTRPSDPTVPDKDTDASESEAEPTTDEEEAGDESTEEVRKQ